jgi:hypothetical protein
VRALRTQGGRQFALVGARPFEEDGADGLLGKPSPKRVPAAERDRMLALYREAYRGWNAKHFHEYRRRDYDFWWARQDSNLPRLPVSGEHLSPPATKLGGSF